MKTTKKHFAIFGAECERLQKRWALTGWQFVHLHEPLDRGHIATQQTNLTQRTITLTFCTDWLEGGTHACTPENIRQTARHEMIHALLAPLSVMAHCRYITPDEYDSAEHEVLRHLENLLPR